MKTIKTLTLVLMCVVFFASCKEKEEKTGINCGFVCSDNLFKFVDIAAIYTTDKGEEISLILTPQNMETIREETMSGETEAGSAIISSGLLEWKQSREYDDKIDAHLTIIFSKKAGVDYASYKGQVIAITKYAYLNSVYTEEQNGWSSISSTQETNFDLNLNTEPDVFYGDALEGYIDKLVSEPIIK